MAYAKIANLYKNQEILLLRECYALEKIHGTSAHISWKDGELHFFAGGVKHENFVKLFDQDQLVEAFAAFDLADEEDDLPITVFGEANGGKCQGMSATYGKELRFTVFEVRIGQYWLTVPDAHEVADALHLEFVPYTKIPTTLEAIDAERDAPSIIAVRRDCGDKKREGVVLRPLIELRKNNGNRIVAKHKADDFRETKAPRKFLSPDKLKIIADAEAIADEWVTANRLDHVIDKLGGDVGVERIGDAIKAMIEDVETEAKDEIVESKAARKAIGKHVAIMIKARSQAIMLAEYQQSCTKESDDGIQA